MLIGGATFAASYVIAAGVGSQWNGTNYGLIPIAGPFIMTGQLLNSGPSCGADGRPLCDLGRTLLVLLAACTAIDGVAQIGGATLLIYGALAPDRVAVPERPSARMVPLATPEGSGLAVVGRF